MTNEHWKELLRRNEAITKKARTSTNKIDHTCKFASTFGCDILKAPYCKEERNCVAYERRGKI